MGMFKCSKNNFTTIKHTYNEYVNLPEHCDATFDTNDQWSFPLMAPVIGMENMVTRTLHRYTWDYLMVGIYSIIKSATKEKLMLFPAKTHSVM